MTSKAMTATQRMGRIGTARKARGRTTPEVRTYRFLAVADLGPEADYTLEPRHYVELKLDFPLDRRAGADSIRRAYRSVICEIEPFVGMGEAAHVWLLADDGSAKLFVSGRLRVLDGRSAKDEVEKFGRSIFPVVREPLASNTVDLLVRAQAGFDVEACSDEDELSDDEAYALEGETLDDLFAEMDTCDLAESEWCNGDSSWWAVGEGWKRISLDLPFAVAKAMTDRQVRFAVAAALQRVSEAGMSGLTPCEDDHDVWLVTGGEPTLNLSLLLDQRDGRLSRPKYRTAVEQALRSVPKSLLSDAA